MNLFMMLAATTSVAFTPQLSNLGVVSTSSGACVGTSVSPSAEITVNWTETNFDPDVHVFKVYENGVLKTTTTSTSWSKSITGNIEDGPYQQWTSDWTYRVDIANAGNGVVLASMTASPWRVLYGSCRDMEDPE